MKRKLAKEIAKWIQSNKDSDDPHMRDLVDAWLWGRSAGWNDYASIESSHGAIDKALQDLSELITDALDASGPESDENLRGRDPMADFREE